MCLHTPLADKVREHAEDYSSRHHLNCLEHYHHARTKHPYFADNINISYLKPLIRYREELREGIENHTVSVMTVLGCEIAEISDAIDRNDMEAAKSECYDAVAVLLRIVDVLNNKQKLGE